MHERVCGRPRRDDRITHEGVSLRKLNHEIALEQGVATVVATGHTAVVVPGRVRALCLGASPPGRAGASHS